jgi:hypothetical protein
MVRRTRSRHTFPRLRHEVPPGPTNRFSRGSLRRATDVAWTWPPATSENGQQGIGPITWVAARGYSNPAPKATRTKFAFSPTRGITGYGRSLTSRRLPGGEQ